MEARKFLVFVGNNQFDTNQVNVLVFVDANKFLKYINQKELSKGTSIVIMDQDRNIIVNIGNEDAIDGLNEVYFNAASNTVIRKNNYENYCTKSEYNSFLYIYRTSNVYGKVHSVTSSNQLLLAVTLILGIVLAMFLSLYLYYPVKNILKLVGNKSTSNANNKYEQTYSGIEQMQKENERYRSLIETA